MSQTIFTSLLLLVAVFVGGKLVDSAATSREYAYVCVANSGLTSNDISATHLRNDDCSIDCVTKQGQMLSFFLEDGKSCGNKQDSTCILGKCMPKEEIKSISTSQMYKPRIKIIEARVRDADKRPGTGSSDSAVLVEIVKNTEPTYSVGETVCYTHVVQDTESPIWNFSCKPKPMKSSALLRFTVFDSDKPGEGHDFLGATEMKLEYLVQQNKPIKLQLRGQDGNVLRDTWLKVEIRGERYEVLGEY